MALGGLVKIITIVSGLGNLLENGETTISEDIKGAKVYAQNGFARWHYSGYSPYDETTNIPNNEAFGLATGAVWKNSRTFGNGELYIEVKLTKNIGTYYGVTYDTEIIKVRAVDLSIPKKSVKKNKKSSNDFLKLSLFGLGAYLLLTD